MRKVSPYLSLLAGALTLAAQILFFYVRFGHMNADAAFMDYVSFFIAGTLGGLVLIYFLNLGSNVGRRVVVFAAFLMITPVAMVLMLGGGMLGWIGVILFPQIPWILMTWIGSLVGKWMVR